MSDRSPMPLDDLLADLLDEQFADILATFDELSPSDETEPVSQSPSLPVSKSSLGRFEIIRELGRGGGGIVFLAFDPQLSRHVALKVPHPEVLVQRELRERFLQEARSAAALRHPHIVPVYEAGEIGPICYIASEYCDGPTLAEWMKEMRGGASRAVGPQVEPGNQGGWQVPVRVAAELVAMLADAVEHAHQHGILHRDLKPSNVLLEERGRASGAVRSQAEPGNESVSLSPSLPLSPSSLAPKLTDFGLAKVMERESQHTRTSAMIGTPAYMAPEQAEGRNADVGPATDVYALGVILYELLSGQTPFQTDSDAKTLLAIASPEPPKPPRRFRRDLPRDLEAICLKCLEKDACQRYDSAAALAGDLRRFLDGRPTYARPEGLVFGTWKWSRRRPALAALALLLALAPIALFVGMAVYRSNVAQVESTATAKIEARDAAERERQRRYDYATHIQGAYQAWQNARLSSAIALLDHCRPAAGEEDLRGWEWYYVRRLCAGGVMTLHGHTGPVRSVAYSPDGRRLASCDADGMLRIWDAVGRIANPSSLDAQVVIDRSLVTIQAHQGGANGVAFSANGDFIASVGDDGYVRLWNAETLQLKAGLQGSVGRIANPSYKVLCVAFSPDGRQIAAAGEEKVIRIWDVESGQVTATLRGHRDTVHTVAFSPQGDRVASGSADRTARVWTMRSGQKLPDGLAAFHPANSNDSASRKVMWRIEATFNVASPVESVAFTPDGESLATSQLELWDLKTGEKRLAMGSHQGPVHAIAFSPDGRLIASGAGDTTVQLREATLPSSTERWDDPALMSSQRHQHTYRGHTKGVLSIAYSPSGDRLASGGRDGTIQIWDPRKLQDRNLLAAASDRAECAAFSPGGGTVAVASNESDSSKITLWGLRDRVPSRSFDLPKNSFTGAMTYSPDGEQLAFAAYGEPLLVRDMTQGINRHFPEHRSAGNSAFSADAQHLAVCFPDGVRILDPAIGEVVASVPGLRAVAFSPDDRLVATQSAEISQDYAVEMWEAATGRSAGRLVGHLGEIDAIAFSADGRLLATGSVDGTARLWDVKKRVERLVLRGHQKPIRSVAFLMNQRSLATASADGTVKIWNVDTGRQLLSLDLVAREGGIVQCMAVSPDGRTLATISKAPDGKRQTHLWTALPEDIDNY